MTMKEFDDRFGRQMIVKANDQIVNRIADLLNDIRIEYISGKISRKEFEEKWQMTKDRIAELWNVETEEV